MYGVFTYIYHTNQPNVGKYSMDPMGTGGSEILPFHFRVVVYPSTYSDRFPKKSFQVVLLRFSEPSTVATPNGLLKLPS